MELLRSLLHDSDEPCNNDKPYDYASMRALLTPHFEMFLAAERRTRGFVMKSGFNCCQVAFHDHSAGPFGLLEMLLRRDNFPVEHFSDATLVYTANLAMSRLKPECMQAVDMYKIQFGEAVLAALSVRIANPAPNVTLASTWASTVVHDEVAGSQKTQAARP